MTKSNNREQGWELRPLGEAPAWHGLAGLAGLAGVGWSWLEFGWMEVLVRLDWTGFSLEETVEVQ